MPFEGQIHHSQLLTNVSNKFRNEEYIADLVWPMVSVVKESDRILSYDKGNLRLEQTARPNKSTARTATFAVSYTTYYLETHALKDIITDQDRANYDPPINADVDASEYLTDQILLRREVAAATVAFTTTTFGTGKALVSATAWRYNTTTTDPSIDAHSAASAILLNSAKRPNQCVMGYNLYNLVRDHVSVLDRIKYTQLGMATPGLVAALFDVDRLVIGTAVRDAGIEGVSSSNTSVWADGFALFHYVPDSPGLRVVSSGYMLTRNAGAPFSVRTWRDEAYKGDWVECETSFAMKAVATSAAYLISGAHT